MVIVIIISIYMLAGLVLHIYYHNFISLFSVAV